MHSPRTLPLDSNSKVSWRSKAMASAHPLQGLPSGMDPSMVDEYTSQSKLLQEFIKIPSIGKALIFSSKMTNVSICLTTYDSCISQLQILIEIELYKLRWPPWKA